MRCAKCGYDNEWRRKEDMKRLRELQQLPLPDSWKESSWRQIEVNEILLRAIEWAFEREDE